MVFKRVVSLFNTDLSPFVVKGKRHLLGLGEGNWEEMGQEQEERRDRPES